MSETLKPCPFCGSDVVACGCCRGCYAVDCLNPDCAFTSHGITGPEGWNRRAMPECVRELLEATERKFLSASSGRPCRRKCEHGDCESFAQSDTWLQCAAVRAYYGETP